MNGHSRKLRSHILLSVQRALIGEIVPNMRAISVEWTSQNIHLWVYIDGPIDEQTREDFDAVVITQIIADFPNPDNHDPVVKFDFVRCDSPEKLDCRGVLVYARKEK
jgi:hypothetical protein